MFDQRLKRQTYMTWKSQNKQIHRRLIPKRLHCLQNENRRLPTHQEMINDSCRIEPKWRDVQSETAKRANKTNDEYKKSLSIAQSLMFAFTRNTMVKHSKARNFYVHRLFLVPDSIRGRISIWNSDDFSIRRSRITYLIKIGRFRRRRWKLKSEMLSLQIRISPGLSRGSDFSHSGKPFAQFVSKFCFYNKSVLPMDRITN